MHEVLTWPAWSVDAMLHFIAVEPMPETRHEILLARMCAMYGEVHRDRNAKAPAVKDYLTWLDAWKDDVEHAGRYTAAELEMLRELQ